MKKIFLLAFLFLTACGANYMQQSEQQLCMDYMTLPSYNVNQSAREQALYSRNIDCNRYVNAARARIESDAAFDNLLQGLSGASDRRSSPPSMPQRYNCFQQVISTNPYMVKEVCR